MEAGNDATAFDMDKVVDCPTQYVDGDWLDVFASDPFSLEPVLIIPIYYRLYKSEDTETPFKFKKIIDDVAARNDSGGDVLPPASLNVVTPTRSIATPETEVHEEGNPEVDASLLATAGSISSSPRLSETPIPTMTPCDPLTRDDGSASQPAIDNAKSAGISLITRVIPAPAASPTRTSSVPPERGPTHPVHSRRAVSIPASERAPFTIIPRTPSTPAMKRTYTTILRSPARSMAGRDSPSGRSTSASMAPSLTPILEEGREIRGLQDERYASATSTPRSVTSVLDHGTYIPASSEFESFAEEVGEQPRELSQPSCDLPMAQSLHDDPTTASESMNSVNLDAGEMGTVQQGPAGGEASTVAGVTIPQANRRSRKKVVVAESSRVLRRKRGADQPDGEEKTDETVPSTPADKSLPPAKKRKGQAGYVCNSPCCITHLSNQ